MVKILLVSASILALGAQGASASPLRLSASAGEAGQGDDVRERKGVVSTMMNHLATLVGFKASGANEDVKHLYANGDDECESAAVEPDKNAGESEPAKKAQPTGPEPIYYGF